MPNKHEWRKNEKKFYLPKNKPEIINVPEFKFITIKGQGNPNSKYFSSCVSTLYSLAYGIKMNLKKTSSLPANYVDFTVYPLEGVWDITEKAKKNFNGTINKDDLVYKLMIRQPNFVDEQLFNNFYNIVQAKKPNPLLELVKFVTFTEGLCIQMLHLGRFEDEHISFKKMEEFANEHSLLRSSKTHREIYLSDVRRVSPNKYKTVLRFTAQPKIIAKP